MYTSNRAGSGRNMLALLFCSSRRRRRIVVCMYVHLFLCIVCVCVCACVFLFYTAVFRSAAVAAADAIRIWKSACWLNCLLLRIENWEKKLYAEFMYFFFVCRLIRSVRWCKNFDILRGMANFFILRFEENTFFFVGVSRVLCRSMTSLKIKLRQSNFFSELSTYTVKDKPMKGIKGLFLGQSKIKVLG